MKLYRYDTKTASVIQTEGEGWPHADTDGRTIYDNTHFKTEREAWDYMLRDAEAGLRLDADKVHRLRIELAKAESQAATSAIEWAAICKARDAFIESADPT